jgi:hypothetical protein
MKYKSLKELEDIAANATRAALSQYHIPDEIRGRLVLGVFFEEDYRIFELYADGERPEDAQVITRARVHAATGDVHVEVFDLPKREE